MQKHIEIQWVAWGELEKMVFCSIWIEPWQEASCYLWVLCPLAGEKKWEAMGKEVERELRGLVAEPRFAITSSGPGALSSLASRSDLTKEGTKLVSSRAPLTEFF